MVVGSLLPLGLVQTWASVEHGYWFARSPELMQTGLMQTLRWMRVPGDTLFAIGAIALAWFVARQTMGERRRKALTAGREPAAVPQVAR
jgi:nitric oxide reductase subunit B